MFSALYLRLNKGRWEDLCQDLIDERAVGSLRAATMLNLVQMPDVYATLTRVRVATVGFLRLAYRDPVVNPIEGYTTPSQALSYRGLRSSLEFRAAQAELEAATARLSVAMAVGTPVAREVAADRAMELRGCSGPTLDVARMCARREVGMTLLPYQEAHETAVLAAAARMLSDAGAPKASFVGCGERARAPSDGGDGDGAGPSGSRGAGGGQSSSPSQRASERMQDIGSRPGRTSAGSYQGSGSSSGSDDDGDGDGDSDDSLPEDSDDGRVLCEECHALFDPSSVHQGAVYMHDGWPGMSVLSCDGHRESSADSLFLKSDLLK